MKMIFDKAIYCNYCNNIAVDFSDEDRIPYSLLIIEHIILCSLPNPIDTSVFERFYNQYLVTTMCSSYTDIRIMITIGRYHIGIYCVNCDLAVTKELVDTIPTLRTHLLVAHP